MDQLKMKKLKVVIATGLLVGISNWAGSNNNWLWVVKVIRISTASIRFRALENKQFIFLII